MQIFTKPEITRCWFARVFVLFKSLDGLLNRVHFSGKISNSVIGFLESKGEDIAPLYEASPVPLELLQDSSYWITAQDMESFLEVATKLPMVNLQRESQESLLIQVGHSVASLRAWGVLDSVLRMMPRPQEIFNQPERFLSYFISPEPPVENILRSENSISFDLPLLAEQYPLVTAYLKAAFEALPVYVGQPLATCEWQGIQLKMNWVTSQSSIFEKDPGHSVSPNLLQSVVDELQKHQRELEEKNRELQVKNEELHNAFRELKDRVRNKAPLLMEESNPLIDMNFTQTSSTTPNVAGHLIGQNLGRLHDYMVRAQQLITLLAAQGKMNPTVKEAMRRTDWDFVKAQYPRAIAESVESLRRLQAQVNQTKASEKSQLTLNQ